MQQSDLKPYWQCGDIRFFQGEVREVLARLPPQSVQCVVTSPPYWGLRDYGTGTWDGGDPSCDHKHAKIRNRYDYTFEGSPEQSKSKVGDEGNNRPHWNFCPDCGAQRIDLQIGSEPSPDCGTHGQAQCGRCFVCSLVSVFREVRRVLRDDGVLWLNLGDSYANSLRQAGPDHIGDKQKSSRGTIVNGYVKCPNGFGPGNLVGVPWRVALALQQDGWTLRQDVIWHKPAVMPESVTNRCTKAHEYVFLLTKGMGYYYDADAIKEKSVNPQGYEDRVRTAFGGAKAEALDNMGFVTHPKGMREASVDRNKRSVWSVSDERALLDYLSENHPDIAAQFFEDCRAKGSVWKVPPQGFSGAHFACFPPRLITPCILAGTSDRGACAHCGSPYKRIVEKQKLTRERPNDYTKRTGEEGTGNSCSNSVAGVSVKTIGWEKTCKCQSDEVVPCIVLDPFCGSGTTQQVCIEMGRASIGIDLSEKYLSEVAIPRVLPFLTQAVLF